MHIDKVSFSKIFPLGDFINHRIGAEVTLIEGESVSEALLMAQKEVELFNKLIIESSPVAEIQQQKMSEIFTVTQKETDIEFDLIKNKLQEFQFKEDAQDYIETTDWRYAVEVKPFINNKPSKHETK